MRPNDLSYRAYWTGLKKNPMADFLKPLVDQGVSFFVCNNALSGFAFELAQKVAPGGASVTRESVVAIHDELAAHFLPGTMLVPAGVAAVNAAQEARFTFLP
jgi:intracellular sulfur oxidation DsrE/DsrF family protein